MASETLSLTIPADLAAQLRPAVVVDDSVLTDAGVSDALATWARREEDREEAQAWIKARVRAWLADPRPSLSLDEVRDDIEKVFARSSPTVDEAA